MKIVHVCAGAEAMNGAAVIAAGFARAEATLGHEVWFVSTSLSASVARVSLDGVHDVVFSRSRLPLFNRLCFSLGLLMGLPRICRDADVVNVHCQWTFPVWWGVWCARRGLVMTPEGSFDPIRLKYGAWKKRLVGWLDRLCVRKASVLHATVPIERDWIRAFEGKVRKVVVVPPGVDVPPPRPWNNHDGPLRILYLGRRHPLKGLDLLHRAVEGLPVDIREEDGLFGEAKERAFEWCDLLCLPTRSENFGLVVAEALAHGKPVITTKGAPWKGIVEHRCGWWTDVDSSSLAAAIKAAIECSPEQLAEMGERGRKWMTEEFSWKNQVQLLLNEI